MSDIIIGNTAIINCSYQASKNTKQLIDAIRKERFRNSQFLFLPDFLACHDCREKPCKSGIDKCYLKDTERLYSFFNYIFKYENIVFAVPVYLNMPTPKLIAFLSRLNSYNDVIGRDLFKNKNAYISVIADVSGTQQTASVLMNSLNMLGFNFRGKCITEHINEWKTNKVRGGYLSENIPYIERKDGD